MIQSVVFDAGALAQFVADAPNAMAMFDREMRYVAASPRWLTDYRLRETPLGRGHYEVFPEVVDESKALHRRCLAGASESFVEERFEHSDGTIRWASWDARPWTGADGAVGGIIIANHDVTALVEARNQAKVSERRLKEAIDAIPAGFDLYDADDRLVASNAAAATMYPHTFEARRPGISFEDLLRIGVERRFHGPSEAENEDWLRERMERHRDPAGPFDQLTVDGKWLRIEEQRLSDGGTVVIRSDVTDIKTREQELADKTNLLEATLESIGEGIAVFDADRRLRIANANAAKLFEVPPSLAQPGVLADDIFRDEARRGLFEDGADVEAFVAERIDEFRKGQPVAGTRRLQDGRTIDIRFDPMIDGGGVFVLRDVTRRAEAQEKAESLATQLATALEQANDNARRAEGAEQRLKDAIEVLPSGFAVYDSDDRLVVFNKATLAMHPKIADEIRPGVSYERLLQAAYDRGLFGVIEADRENWIRERLEEHHDPGGPVEQLTNAGRWLRIEHRRMSDGGVVTSRTDITDLKTRERELADKSALLEATLHNMGEGLAAFDADRKLLVINDYAIRLVDCPKALAQPGVTYDDILRFLATTEGPDSRDAVEPFVTSRVALFRAGSPFVVTRLLNDGRTIETRFNPMPGGGGVFVYRDVTERAEFETKLTEKTFLLETTFENVDEGIAVYDGAGRLLARNDLVLELIGVPAALMEPKSSIEELIRFRAERGDYAEPDVEASVRARMASFNRGDQFRIARRLPDGRLTEVRSSPMPGGGAVFIILDITDQAASEATIAEKTALLEATLENMGEAIAVYGADLKLRLRNDLATRLLDTPAGLFEPGATLQDIYKFRVARGDYGDVAPDEIVDDRVERFLAGDSAGHTSSRAGDRTIESRFNPLPDGGGIYVFGDVTERERTNSRIREEEAKFRSLVEQNVAGIVIVRNDGTIGYGNRLFAKMLGYEPAEIVGRALLDFFNEAEHAIIAERVQALFTGDGAPVQLASTARTRDGGAIEVLVNASKAIFEGRTAGIAVVVDVTARNRAQRELASTAAILTAVHESSPDGILVVDPANRVLSVNRRFGEISGVPVEMLDGADFGPLSALAAEQVDDPESFRQRVRYFDEHIEEPGHDELILKDGRAIDRLTAPFHALDGGYLGRIWFFRDISERRRGESALRASEERFRMLIEEAPDAILIGDEQGFLVAVNKAAESLFGAPRQALLGNGLKAFYAPEQPDGRPLAETFREHNLRALAGEVVHYDRRICRPSGEVRHCHATLVRIESDAMLLRASYVDVTEQRAAEESLRAGEERFRMLIEEAPDAILLFDCDEDRFIAANRAAETLFGVPRQEILAKWPTHFDPLSEPDGKARSLSFADYTNRASAGKEVRFEWQIRRPLGQERICHVTMVRLPSKVRLIRTSLVDVTEQRAAEAELSEVQRDVVARQEAQRQRIARELHDSLGQYLAAMNIKLQLLAQVVGDDSLVKAGLADLKALTSTVGTEVSRIAWELRPTAIDDIGLEAAIQRFVEEWSARSGLRFDCHLALKNRRLPPPVETTLYRVLQEGVTNVIKHANAKNVGVAVKALPDSAVMMIEDDGVGFEMDSLAGTSRLGLRGMRERLAAVHGGLEIETAPGKGTTLIIRVALGSATGVDP